VPPPEGAPPTTPEVVDVEAIGAESLPPAPIERRPRHWLVRLSWAWIGVVVFGAVFANFLPLADPNALDVSGRLGGPGSPGHLLGADGLGRDILSRIVFGSRVSLVVSLASVSIGMTVGGTLGMVVGYFRGKLEAFVMAGVNVLLAFPALILLLALVAFVGQSLIAITLVIGFVSIPIYTRVARATTLGIAQREFVLAARAMGARHHRIIVREILPNVVLPVLAFGLVAVGALIVLEGALAFLGLSVQPPTPTWGSMIAEGKRHLSRTAHVAFVPSTVMFLTVLSVNFVGDSLRRRFDVKESYI